MCNHITATKSGCKYRICLHVVPKSLAQIPKKIGNNFIAKSNRSLSVNAAQIRMMIQTFAQSVRESVFVGGRSKIKINFPVITKYFRASKGFRLSHYLKNDNTKIKFAKESKTICIIYVNSKSFSHM